MTWGKRWKVDGGSVLHWLCVGVQGGEGLAVGAWHCAPCWPGLKDLTSPHNVLSLYTKAVASENPCTNKLGPEPKAKRNQIESTALRTKAPKIQPFSFYVLYGLQQHVVVSVYFQVRKSNNDLKMSTLIVNIHCFFQWEKAVRLKARNKWSTCGWYWQIAR